jgi:pre-mRNA-splicing factor SYF2
MERLKGQKKNPDQGFSTYEAATVRQHNRLVQHMKVDLHEYQEEKEKVGEEAFYANKNTLIHGLHQDKQENIDKMVVDFSQGFKAIT